MSQKNTQASIKRIPRDIFKQIEYYVPFSSVDMIVLFDNRKVLLTKRAIQPYFGYWHLPGSVVLKKEKMVDTVKRSAKEELGIEVKEIKFLGNYELFTRNRHYITHAFIAKYKRGKIKLDSQSSNFIIADVRDLPECIIPIQKQMIMDFLARAA